MRENNATCKISQLCFLRRNAWKCSPKMERQNPKSAMLTNQGNSGGFVYIPFLVQPNCETTQLFNSVNLSYLASYISLVPTAMGNYGEDITYIYFNLFQFPMCHPICRFGIPNAGDVFPYSKWEQFCFLFLTISFSYSSPLTIMAPPLNIIR